METAVSPRLTVTDAAKRFGVSKAAMSKKVAKLRASGALKPPAIQLNHLGHVTSIDAAHLEHVLAKFGDAGRSASQIEAQSPADQDLRPHAAPLKGSLDEAKLREARIRAERAALELAEKRQQLCRVDRIDDAASEMAGILVEVLQLSLASVEELFGAADQDGLPGLRRALVQHVDAQRKALADALKARAETAPEAEEAPNLDHMIEEFA